MDLSRREFLKASGLFATWAALAACSPFRLHGAGATEEASPERPLLLAGDALLIHTLRRITFGPTPAML